MTRTAPLFTLAISLAAFGCKNQPEAGYDNQAPGGEQAYSTVPTQDALQTAADEDAARREQEEADAAAAAAAKPATPPPLNDADKKFVDDATLGGLAEVDLSKAALEKSKKDSVKEFAQKMIDDHTKAGSELAAFASGRGITVPTEPDELTKQRRADLEKKTGSKFDKAYIDAMLQDHRKAVELFRTQSTTGTDPDLKNWASTTLPTLEQHLAHVEALSKGKTYKAPADNAATASTGTATTDTAKPTPAGGTTPVKP